MGAQQLAYVGLGVSDPSAWTAFATKSLGLVAQSRAGTPRLRLDRREWRIAVHRSNADDILYAGFDVGDFAALERLGSRLAAEGQPPTPLKPEEAEARGVDQGFWLPDPGGLRLEFTHCARPAVEAFASPLTDGFVTGEQGLGHIVLSVADLTESLAFYERLGFSVSDYITAPVGPAVLRIAFLHCNTRHHTIAIAQLPGAKRLNHLMLELCEVDDVIRGHQRCKAQGFATGGLGRHPNDRMLSFYVTSPAGFAVEYGWGGRQVTDDWVVSEYGAVSVWGHERG